MLKMLKEKAVKAVVLAIVISTGPSPVWWFIGGPLEVSTMTPAMTGMTPGPVSDVILRSPNGVDCYRLGVTPNGTITRTWVQCPAP